MKDTLIKLPAANVENRNFAAMSEADGQNTVRVFRIMPERVTLQIRAEKRYATASLPAKECRQLVAALVEGLAEIEPSLSAIAKGYPAKLPETQERALLRACSYFLNMLPNERHPNNSFGYRESYDLAAALDRYFKANP